MSFFAKIKLLFSRDSRNLYTVKEFAHANKDLLIIICDPKTDRMFVTYRDRFVNGTIKGVNGKRPKVVHDVLHYSLFDKSVDSFLASIMETLHLPIWRANQFYQFLDAALFKIAGSLRKKRQPEPIKSPYKPTINNK